MANWMLATCEMCAHTTYFTIVASDCFSEKGQNILPNQSQCKSTLLFF